MIPVAVFLNPETINSLTITITPEAEASFLQDGDSWRRW